MPLEWPAMVIVFTANPLVPNPEDSNPYPTGRASLVHFLSAPPRAPPPALWSGHYTGPLAAGMVRGGCRTIPEARGRSQFGHSPALTPFPDTGIFHNKQ